MDGLGFGSVLAVNPPSFDSRPAQLHGSAPERRAVASSTRDVDFALVTSHGNKGYRREDHAGVVHPAERQIRQGRFPATVARRVQGCLCRVEERPGTAGCWHPNQRTGPSQRQRRMKIIGALGIRAVEDLANANEELISETGYGWSQPCVAGQGLGPDESKARHRLWRRWTPCGRSTWGQQRTIDALTQRIGILEARLAQSGPNGAASGLPPLEDRLSQAQAKNPGMSDDRAIRDARWRPNA